MADVEETDKGADVMVDPDKKLTPLQRRRLREGKPFTSRKLNTFQRLAEDELDKRVEQHLKTLDTNDTPYIQTKIKHEHEDVVERKAMRDKEHARRAYLHKERQAELLEIQRRKMEKIYEMEESLMTEESRLQSKRRRERQRAVDNLDRKLRGLPEKTEEDEEDENAQQQGAEEGAPSAVETLFENEAHRLEMMLDQTVMSEERRLRAMLDVGTPDNLTDVIRRLRADDPRLVKVTLRQNDISFAQAAALADAISHNTCLLALDFRYNKIGDYGCKLIADALVNCPSIGELRVQPNDTGKNGMEALMEAARLSQFQAMSISSATLAMPEQSFAPLMLRTQQD